MMRADEIEDEIARIGADRESGATALALRAIAVLGAAPADPHARRRIALALCRAQPSMAGFRTAAALAVAAEHPGQVLEELASRLRRAPAAIARYAVPFIRLRWRRAMPLRIVTCSRSAAVEATLIELGQAEALQVSCSEALPAREGLRLAERIAATGVIVEVYTDAGLGASLPDADALVVGADAVSTSGFINKVGTAALAALARLHGVPVIVLASREKIVPPAVFDTLSLAGGDTAELCMAAANCELKNPLFERIPAELPADLITDGGHTPLENCDSASLWSPDMREMYLSVERAGNMLDKH